MDSILTWLHQRVWCPLVNGGHLWHPRGIFVPHICTRCFREKYAYKAGIVKDVRL